MPDEAKNKTLPDLPDGNQVANLSIPGLLGSLVVFLLFLPPHPIDTIPVVDFPAGISHTSPPPRDGAILRDLLIPVMLPKPESAPTNKNGQPYGRSAAQGAGNPDDGPKCKVKEYWLNGEPRFPPFHKDASQALQLFLEEQKESLQECLALEKRDTGKEKTDNDADARELAVIEKVRDAGADLTVQLQDFRSPAAPIESARTETIKAAIQQIRNRIEEREQSIRAREYEIAELTRFSAWVDVRLADPGRLRPEQSLGDYLKALSDHLSGFLGLAAGIGTIFKVLISPIGSKVGYRFFFKEEM